MKSPFWITGYNKGYDDYGYSGGCSITEIECPAEYTPLQCSEYVSGYMKGMHLSQQDQLMDEECCND